jgi:cyclomaltodextrinase
MMNFSQRGLWLQTGMVAMTFLATVANPVIADEGVVLSRPVAASESVTFRYSPPADQAAPRTVVVIGSFNRFSHTANPMTLGADGAYTVTLQLTPGIHYYKFLIDDKIYLSDPAADRSLENTADHNNSGIIVGPDWRKLPPPSPDAIDATGLAHDAKLESDANVATPSTIRLRVRTRADDVQNVIAWYRATGQTAWQRQTMWPREQITGQQAFGSVVTVTGAQVEYFFEIEDGAARAFVASGRLYESRQPAEKSPFEKEMKPAFETPDWAKHAVWYQVFVERFRNGDTANDPPNTQRWQSSWYATLPGESDGNFYKEVYKRRYGGDLQGLREQLPYLRKLGITALYLNPIFQADSLHKYDTRDYRHVDDYFAVKDSAKKLTGETDDPATWQWSESDKLFLDFVQEAHQQGFKVIVDGVFNHVGTSHPFFQDVLKNGRQSRYADWFKIIDWGTGGPPGKPGGVEWDGWGGKRNGGLPVLQKDPKLGLAPGPREHIMAVTRRWLAPGGDVSRGIDGFRLDAANEVPHAFWVDWRKLVKSINPDAYINGELWGWSQAWLKGDEFDAVMNYQFAMPSQNFFADKKKALSPTAFDKRLDAVFGNYPLQVVLAQQNLYDSHDTDRFASRFVNPDMGYDQGNRMQQADGANYDTSKPSPVDWKRMRQAVAFQMTFAGAPMVYYGDEAGMWSADDPSDRMPMWWQDLAPFDDELSRFDPEQFASYQRAIAVRHRLPALQTGGFHGVLCDDARGIYAFARDAGAKTAWVVVNRSPDPARVELPLGPDTADGVTLVDWLDPKQADLIEPTADATDARPALRLRGDAAGVNVQGGTVRLDLPAYGTAVLSSRNQEP